MKDYDLDKLFQDQIGSTQMEVDTDEIWNNIDPSPKKKKRRFFFWWLSGLGVLILMIAGLFFLNTSDQSIEKQETISMESETREVITDPSTTKEMSTADTSTDIKPNLDPIVRLKTTTKSNLQTENNQTTTNNNTLLTTNTPSNTITHNSQNFSTTKPETDNLNTKHTTPFVGAITRPTINHQKHNSRSDKNLQELKPKNPQILAIQVLAGINTKDLHIAPIPLSFSLPQNLEKDLIVDPVKSLNHWEIEAYLGYGFNDKQLSALNPSSQELVDRRLEKESDRFVYYQGVNLTKWWVNGFGLTLNGTYARSYSYLQDTIGNIDIDQNQFQTTFTQTNRIIKSNIIFNQLHTGLLLNYRFKVSKLSIQPAVGLSYNAFINGKGKFFTSTQTIANFSDEGVLQNASLGYLGKINMQYALKSDWYLNFALQLQHNTGSILNADDISQKIRTQYMTIGLSKRL